jgi:hypothetical protein
MAIDPLNDDTLSLNQAARRLPCLRAGRPVHTSTLWRWAQKGLRGVKLETAMVGGIRVTSEAALRAFFAEVSATATPEGKAPLPDSPAQGRSRTRRDEDVERQLDAEGL